MRRLLTTLTMAGVLLLGSQSGYADLWYDFEGDSGGTVTDKLTGDGAQDGTIFGNVSITPPGNVLWGANSGQFDIPDPLQPTELFSTAEIPGTTALGDSYTLALRADNKEGTLGFTRLISSYRGTGPVSADRIILDYDPTGGVIPGIRAIINNTVVGTSSVPAGMADPGYNNYALTVDNGAVNIYFNGSVVASGNVGTGYSNSANLRLGEDPHDGGGSANEQFIGNMDEVLVIDRALSASEIAQLGSGTVSSVITPGQFDFAVYYDLEGDSGTSITDKFAAFDGSQNGIVHNNVAVDTGAANAALGSGSLVLGNKQASVPFSVIDTGVSGNLGSELTLSAVINVPAGGGHAGGGLARVFSTYGGSGSAAGRLILDINPAADVSNIGVRLLLPNGVGLTSNSTFSVDEDHTITAVYDNGDVRLYMDGSEIASGSGSGDIDLGAFMLRIGEDLGGALNENFIGTMDDVFVISRALSPAEVMAVAELGAAAVVPEPSSIVLTLMACMAMLGITRRRSPRS